MCACMCDLNEFVPQTYRETRRFLFRWLSVVIEFLGSIEMILSFVSVMTGY